MVFFNYALRKLNAKIVYYGPGLGGKTTNLVWIHDHFEGGERGKMISLATEGDRTIFFDLLPLEIGSIRGMEVTLQLYTVPGQVHYNSTRQLVLRGADGVVFVADSQRAMQSSNVDSFKNLQENLLLQGISLDGFPHVLQFNKRDLKNLVTVEELNDDLNHYSVPIFEAVATEGVGVQETLEGIVKLVMRNLRQRYEGATAGARTPGIEDPHVQVPGMPMSPPGGPTDVRASEVSRPVAFADEPTSVDELTEPPEPPLASSFVEPTPVEEEATEDEQAFLEEPPGPAILEPLMPEDPARTIDFSQSEAADFSDDPGGRFEDEVSTGVYDLNDDSAIDFDELKRLDAPGEVPEIPSAEETPFAAESSMEEETPLVEEFPEAELPEAEIIDTVAGEKLSEASEEVPSGFDLESTDAGLKTQELSQLGEEDPMGAFDFNAPPPDVGEAPEFELDAAEPEPLPEPEPSPEPAPWSEPGIETETDQQPELDVEAEFEPDFEADGTETEHEVPTFEVETIPQPVVEEEVSEIPEEPVAEDVIAAAPPKPPPAEGPFVDRIEAPGPFAPDAEAPRDEPEVFQALREASDVEAEEPAPEEPELVPVMELPTEEPAEGVAAVTQWDEPSAADLVAEAIGEESASEFEEALREEPVAGETGAEGAEEDRPVEAVAGEASNALPDEDFGDETWQEPTAEEAVVEEPMVEFTAEAGGESTPEQLLAEVMGLESAAPVDEESPEESPGEEAPEETEFEQPDTDDEEVVAVEEPETEFVADTWEEPTEEEGRAEAEFEEADAGFVAEAWEETTGGEDEAQAEFEEPAADFEPDSWEEPTEEDGQAEAEFEQPDAEFAAESRGETTEVGEDEAQAEFEEPAADFEPDFREEPAEEEPVAVEAPPPEDTEEEEIVAAADAAERDLFDSPTQEPVVVGNEDPWTEEELSDVYRISEVEKAEQAAAIEAATPRAVDIQAEDNQLHLRLQGSGAIVEAGQVRALDIEVPVPGSWVGNKRVTLQLRLTLTPDLEDENDRPGSPS